MDVEYVQTCTLCDSDALVMLDPDCAICQCRSCGHVFDSPRPSSAEVMRFYSQASKYDPWMAQEGAWDRLWRRRLKKMPRPQDGGSLLDVGAGIGQFLHHAKAWYAAVEGTEVSESAVAIARQKYRLTLTKGRLKALVFAAEAFETITLFHVLEHVPDPGETLARCWQLLHEGGVLVIAVPNDLQSLRTQVKRWVRCLGLTRFRHIGKLGLPRLALDGSLDEIHMSHFTPEVLRRALERLGFCVVEESLDPYYAATGLMLALHTAFYWACLLLFRLARLNLYDTIWMVAQKRAEPVHVAG